MYDVFTADFRSRVRFAITQSFHFQNAHGTPPEREVG
jgi:hypothetical protein